MGILFQLSLTFGQVECMRDAYGGISVQYIDSGWNFKMVRLGVNRFDGTHKADDIEAWFIHNLKQFIPDKLSFCMCY